jgi:hypothetical protein
MKSLLVALLATGAVTVAAAPASASYAGYYLATFTTPAGSFQHCFALTQTQIYKDDGYKFSGTWVDTDFPDTTGTWVVSLTVMHLAGSVDGGGYLALDGRVKMGALHKTTFDYFDGSGTYFAAGSFVETADPSCAGAVRRTPR